MPSPSMRAKRSKSSSASVSPSRAASTTSRPETLPLGGRARRPSTLSGLSLGELGRVALERLAAAVAPRGSRGSGSCPGSGGPSGSIDDVAELGAEAVGAAEDRAVDHHPAADAGAEREHHEMAARARRARAAPRRARRSWRRCRRTRARRGACPARRAAATPVSGMFTLVSTVPVAKSIWDGHARPRPRPAARPARPPRARPPRDRRAAPRCSSSSVGALDRRRAPVHPRPRRRRSWFRRRRRRGPAGRSPERVTCRPRGTGPGVSLIEAAACQLAHRSTRRPPAATESRTMTRRHRPRRNEDPGGRSSTTTTRCSGEAREPTPTSGGPADVADGDGRDAG